MVVDASLALKWVLEESYSAEARDLLDNWRRNARELLAPTLFPYEVANVLVKRIRRRELTLDQAKDRLVFLGNSGPAVLSREEIHRRALELAEQFGFSAAYDAHYLALAENLDCEFWTADERLWNSVRRKVTRVRWIGEWSNRGRRAR